VVQPQEQIRSQIEGAQSLEAPNNEPQQPIMAKVPSHHIRTKYEERKEQQVLSTSQFLTL